MDSQIAIDILEKIKAKTPKVMVIGDVMLDKFIYGEVTRISPEAPVPVLNVKEKKKMLGGAGNVVRNLLSLGGCVSLQSVMGMDKSTNDIVSLVGDEIKKSILRLTADFVYEKDRNATVKTRYIAGSNHHLIRADVDWKYTITDSSQSELISNICRSIDDNSIIVISDYEKGVLTHKVIKSIIAIAKERKIPVIVDPKKQSWKVYEGATIITPNSLEIDYDHKHLFPYVLITQGKHGMTLNYQDKYNIPYHINSSAYEVTDVSGAGDTVVAMLALAYAVAPDKIEHCAELANIAAGIVVGKEGTATVTMQEVLNELM